MKLRNFLVVLELKHHEKKKKLITMDKVIITISLFVYFSINPNFYVNETNRGFCNLCLLGEAHSSLSMLRCGTK